MKLKSKRPHVVKEIVKSKTDGNYVLYSLSTDTGCLEDLTYEDIVFIRNKFSEFISGRKKGGKQ